MKIRKAQDRGQVNFGWLQSAHTFSFGRYYDPAHMGYGALRVINDDIVAGGKGFDEHPHNDMEIITYILDGVLEHKDSMGNTSQIKPGDIQRMSAGTGVRHSEYNASPTDPVHLLQIWVLPEKLHQTPSYEQKNFTAADKRGQFRLIGSQDGRDGSITIGQDIKVYASILDGGDAPLSYDVAHDRQAWLHVARGSVTVNDHVLNAGDAVAVKNTELRVSDGREAEVLLFDMAAAA